MNWIAGHHAGQTILASPLVVKSSAIPSPLLKIVVQFIKLICNTAYSLILEAKVNDVRFLVSLIHSDFPGGRFSSGDV